MGRSGRCANGSTEVTGVCPQFWIRKYFLYWPGRVRVLAGLGDTGHHTLNGAHVVIRVLARTCDAPRCGVRGDRLTERGDRLTERRNPCPPLPLSVSCAARSTGQACAAPLRLHVRSKPRRLQRCRRRGRRRGRRGRGRAAGLLCRSHRFIQSSRALGRRCTSGARLEPRA